MTIGNSGTLDLINDNIEIVDGKVDIIDDKIDIIDSTVNDIDGKVDIVDGYTKKIDNATTNGLSGVNNSLSYRAEEIEKHLHNQEKWFGAAAVPDAELHVADRMAGGIAPFQLIAGNDDFGDWVQILGSDDTPVGASKVKFDLHRAIVTDTNSTNPFIIQIVCGESAGIAAKILAEDFTEFPYVSATNNNDSGISDLLDQRELSGAKVWARAACIGSSGSTFDFYMGAHEYEG